MEENLENLFDLKMNPKVKVSTVMNNLSSENGKQFLNDGNDDTCWSSAEGNFQYIYMCFDSKSIIKNIEITCSGGFCPRVF